MIGILGGMGPYATLVFYKKILDLTGAKKDSDHIHLWIDSNVKIPSRNRHFIYNEESPVKGIIDSVTKMKDIGIKNIYLPCNSASYFIPEVLEKVQGISIVGTINTTIKYITSRYKNKKVMVLGAHIIYNKEPYKMPLEVNGFDYIKHDQAIQKRVENLIYQVKTDNFDADLIEEALYLYTTITKQYNIDLLVLGCTELCIVFDALKNLEVTILDTNHILAKYLVKKEK